MFGLFKKGVDQACLQSAGQQAAIHLMRSIKLYSDLNEIDQYRIEEAINKSVEAQIITVQVALSILNYTIQDAYYEAGLASPLKGMPKFRMTTDDTRKALRLVLSGFKICKANLDMRYRYMCVANLMTDEERALDSQIAEWSQNAVRDVFENDLKFIDTTWVGMIVNSSIEFIQNISTMKSNSENIIAKNPAHLHKIDVDEITSEFRQCWKSAGSHIQSKAPKHEFFWLKSDLQTPLLSHFAFRVRNQIFFVLVETSENLNAPGNLAGLRRIAEGCEGHACILPMKMGPEDRWTPVNPGWGLLDADSRISVDPMQLLSNVKIEMTDWELHDFAVQVVTNAIKNDGKNVIASLADPAVDPSVWFEGDRGPEWVIVRAARYPDSPSLPKNVSEITASCKAVSNHGNFAPVTVTSEVRSTPLWRGSEMQVRYTGLLPADIIST
ncbi:conserved hypothetical protein [Sphingomonas aurantiaca]|uniref:Uncharacterized protein n=1 Tax=Sphingomonas aurantiaca TaxID=185949 RepID=A0A5E7XZK2_9SPHN|nr:hypothetical protein [Sphingomonas aurantiaca]VVS99696.1 conserved hypothetical protein [Sphingomonas aurantiaca]